MLTLKGAVKFEVTKNLRMEKNKEKRKSLHHFSANFF